MVEQRNQRDWRERFVGFRVNCESVPRLSARLVRIAIDDPRGIPYLLLWLWKDEPPIKEAARVAWLRQDDWIEVKRPDCAQRIRMCRTCIPHGGAALLLFCPDC